MLAFDKDQQQLLDPLERLRGKLMLDCPIEVLEQYEAAYKRTLSALFAQPMSAALAAAIANFQKQINWLLKYKSYAIKASNPLGYSIFLQNPGEGFSFQQHTQHKLEVFHILEVLAGGFVFICDFAKWREVYQPQAFAAWLAGAADARYERYRYRPLPGDVFIIDQLNTVHTVLGCVLEEYATVSTDMVDRLYDQNKHKVIPPQFCREYALQKIQAIQPPAKNRLIYQQHDTWIDEELEGKPIKGGTITQLASLPQLTAARMTLKSHAGTDFFPTRNRALSVFVTAGRGEIRLADADAEARSTAPEPPCHRVELSRGDNVLLAPGIHFAIQNTAELCLEVSLHSIAADTAFAKQA